MVTRLPDFVAVDWIGTIVPTVGARPYQGSLEALSRLRNRGTTVVVVSSASPSLIHSEVERVGLQSDDVIGTPDKAGAFSELRMRYGQGFALGDHAGDFRAARDAGLGFVQACLEGQPRMQGRDGAFERWIEVETLLGAD